MATISDDNKAIKINIWQTAPSSSDVNHSVHRSSSCNLSAQVQQLNLPCCLQRGGRNSLIFHHLTSKCPTLFLFSSFISKRFIKEACFTPVARHNKARTEENESCTTAATSSRRMCEEAICMAAERQGRRERGSETDCMAAVQEWAWLKSAVMLRSSEEAQTFLLGCFKASGCLAVL